MPRNTAQQLYDVGYVVYGGEREVGGRKGGERGGKRKKDAKERREGGRKCRQRKTEKERVRARKRGIN